jgi:trigger factor
LKIEKFPQEDHQMKLVVEIEQDRMEASKRRAARKMAQRGKIPGFRPGKAPYDVIRRHYGDEAIIEQALDMLVDEVYPDILKEADINPGAAGSLESIDGLEPPKLSFIIPLAPTVELGDYRSIREKYEFKTPDKKRIDEEIESLRQMYANTETVERAVEMGDFVLVDVKGEKDKAEEGEDQSELSRSGMAIAIKDEEKDDEWPFPGFAKKLIGTNPGESKTIKHKYPKDYEDESLQGQAVTFNVDVKTVRAVILPELDDEFAKSVGDFESVEKLRETVAENLEQRLKAEYEDEYLSGLVDKVREGATINYPPQVLEHEMEHVAEDLGQRLASQGMDLDTYIKMRQSTKEKFMEEEVRPVAIKRLERSLLMDELTRAEKIEIDDKALDEEFNNTLGELSYQGFDASKIQGGKRGQQEFAQAVAMESATRLLTRRTLERLKAIATGEVEAEEKAAKKAAKQKAAEEKAQAEEEPKAKKKTSAKATKAKTETPAEEKPKAKKTTAKKTTKKAEKNEGE